MTPEFKIANQTYKFEDITITQWYNIKSILAKTPSAEIEFEIVEALTKCPIKTLKTLPYDKWLVIWAEANWQIQELAGDTSTISPIIEFQGQRYGLPSIEDITVGEFSDLDLIASGGAIENNLVEIAAIVYRPIVSITGDKINVAPYDIEGFNIRKEAFKDFPVSAIRSANAFFLQCAQLSLKNTGDFLVKELEKTSWIPQDVLEDLKKPLQQEPGGDLSIHLQELILSSLNKLPGSRYAPLSTGLLGKKPKTKNINSLFQKLKSKL
jgi:hypothetical protein